VGPAFDAAFFSDPCAVPCSTSVTLGEGTYLVFAQIDPVTGRSGVFRPSDMALTTDGDVSLQVSATRSDETIDRNGSVYRGVLRFTVAEPGRYRVALKAPAGARIVIAPSLMQTFVRALPAVGLVVAALPVGVTGLVLVLLGGRRSNRELG
jgi:hypothetical protein